MQKNLLGIFMFFLVSANGQNEFGATAFYTDFKKICADAQTGFSFLKGDLNKELSTDLEEVYNIKFLLPLADSGKIIISGSNAPFVVYFFEPDKIRLKVDQRGANLRDAIVLAFGKPLFSRTETDLIGKYPNTNSWYFAKPDETNKDNAVFKMSIYYADSKYFLSLEIRGKKI